mmetsp:Transcript_28676/g.85696  ORF Transcript_28676/g.85696 Transcript_28676/m.85696 type:complete len:209 (+) Transcript_28676:428-1054(+)
MSLMFARTRPQKSSKSTGAPQASHAARPTDPCTAMILSGSMDVWKSNPSIFCVKRRCSFFFWSSTSRKRWKSVAFHCFACVPRMNGRRTSWYGNWFSMNISFTTTYVGSRRMSARCSSDAVSSSGRSVSYIPPGDLKSGMPAAALTPAPLRTTTFLQASLAMNCATPFRSRDSSRLDGAIPRLPTARTSFVTTVSAILNVFQTAGVAV